MKKFQLIKGSVAQSSYWLPARPVLLVHHLKTLVCSHCSMQLLEYLPSPVDIDHIVGKIQNQRRKTRKLLPEEPILRLAFKICRPIHMLVKLTYCRVYFRYIKGGFYTYNSTRKEKRYVDVCY